MSVANQVLYKLPVVPQLEALLSRKDIKPLVNLENIARRSPNDDLYTSPRWRQKAGRYERLSTPRSDVLTLSVGVDGVEILGRSFWLLVATVGNIPRAQRYRRKNLIAIGILMKKPPSLSGMLHSFVKEVTPLHPTRGGGHCWGVENFTLYVVVLMVKTDYPALCLCMGLKGHTSNFGCAKCKVSVHFNPTYVCALHLNLTPIRSQHLEFLVNHHFADMPSLSRIRMRIGEQKLNCKSTAILPR